MSCVDVLVVAAIDAVLTYTPVNVENLNSSSLFNLYPAQDENILTFTATVRSFALIILAFVI